MSIGREIDYLATALETLDRPDSLREHDEVRRLIWKAIETLAKEVVEEH